MEKNENDFLVEQLNSLLKFEIPKFEIPSIPIDGLIINKKISKISFKNGYYDIKTKILHMDNGETFEGEINLGNICTLNEGRYKWPSGQTFNGQFIKKDEYEGKLKLKDGCIYEGKFNNKNFIGVGELKYNENKIIRGNFIEGKINGEVIIKNQIYNLKANYVNSNIEGEVKEFNISLNNINYKFPKFNYQNGNIKEKLLTLEKDNKNITFINKECKVKNDKNKNDITLLISEKELETLNYCFNLPDELIPEIKAHSIPEEGLIDSKKGDDFTNIIFENGIKANFDEENDVHILTLPNGEKFEGILNDDGEGKFWIEKGKYIWPSGQEYNGDFNEKNQFESDYAELKKNNEWCFQGMFKAGKINRGKFEFVGTNNYLDAYFSDGKINGNTTIKKDDIIIKGVFTNSGINEFEATFNKHTYKIIKLDKCIDREDLLYIEKDDKEYFIVGYNIINNKITIDKNIINQEETNYFKKILNDANNLKFPHFEKFSYGELVPINDNSSEIDTDTNENIINFKSKINYNKETKILSLPNGEKFQGVLNEGNLNFSLSSGEYKWPSGQKYIGRFNENNKFEGEARILLKNNCEIKGKFKDGNLNESCEIVYENGDYIKANFENGKISGNFNLKKNQIFLEGDYTDAKNKGTFKNINLKIKENNYQIPEINIIKEGYIKENILEVKKDGKKLELKIGNEIEHINEILAKIREMKIVNFSPILIQGNNLIIKKKAFTDNNNVKLIFQNQETFKGSIEENEKEKKYYLVKGEYEWPSGQKYIGEFKENKFHTQNGILIFKDKWKYEGEFKDGFIEGNGIYENKKGEYIKGYFEKGEIKKDIIFHNNDIDFEGDFSNSIKDINIKFLRVKINGHIYEISEFNINDNIIKVKKDEITNKTEISNDLKLKIIESLIIKTKPVKYNFFYNESQQEKLKLYDDNKMKIIKIKDNIEANKLSKLSIYYNKLSSQNKKKKVQIGKILGLNLNQKLGYNELMLKIKLKQRNKYLNTFTAFTKETNIEEQQNSDIFKEIEEQEILRICNSKMLKDMEEEISLRGQDINTLKKEKEILEKEKINKIKELKDLEVLYNQINENCNELKNKKNKIEEDTKKINENLHIFEENNFNIKKYLNNLKIKGKSDSKNDIIKVLQSNNNKIITKIKKQEGIINKDKQTIKELSMRIKELENTSKKKKI